MRSSPAYAVSNLELPAVTAAAKASALLVILAAAFAAWACIRAGMTAWLPGAVLLAGGAVCAGLRWQWRRASRAPVRQLESRPDGSIWLRQTGAAPVAVTVGRGTRLLGPSVFLDLQVADPQSPGWVRCWMTPFDAPWNVMRQWSVVLPRGGRVACT